MTDTNRTIAETTPERAANGALRTALTESAELRNKVEEVITDLAKAARKNALRKQKLAKREARALYRQSTRTIKRNPWRTVGLTLLAGVVAGGLVALTRTPPAPDADS